MTERILHVSQPGDGGVATVVASYVRAQVTGGREVALACPGGTDLAGWAREAGATVLAWEAGRAPSPQIRDEVSSLDRLIQRWSPDVVHLHSSKAGLAGRLALRGRVPTLFQPHAWSFHAVDGAQGVLSTAWERWAQRWTDLTICVSAAEQAAGERHGIDGPTVIVPNTVDPGDWKLSDRAQARADLGLPADAPIAVCVARVCEQKGQDILTALWPDLRAHLPHARLVLVGDGPAKDALARTAPAEVTFVGAQNPRPYLAAADLVVAASRWEGMALAPMEAQASGRHVVAFDVDGMNESLADDSDLLPAGDVPALLETLVARLTDLSDTRRRGDNARVDALTRWRPSDQSKAVTAAYQRARFLAENR